MSFEAEGCVDLSEICRVPVPVRRCANEKCGTILRRGNGLKFCAVCQRKADRHEIEVDQECMSGGRWREVQSKPAALAITRNRG